MCRCTNNVAHHFSKSAVGNFQRTQASNMHFKQPCKPVLNIFLQTSTYGPCVRLHGVTTDTGGKDQERGPAGGTAAWQLSSGSIKLLVVTRCAPPDSSVQLRVAKATFLTATACCKGSSFKRRRDNKLHAKCGLFTFIYMLVVCTTVSLLDL